jgi:hypothetical protein
MSLFLRTRSFALVCFLVLPGPARAAPEPAAEDLQVLKVAGVTADGPALLAYLRLRTMTPTLRSRALLLLGLLGSESYDEREKATAALLELGPVAIPVVMRGAGDGDLEVRRRSRRVLESLERRREPSVVEAVVRVLAVRAPTGTTAALLAYLPSTPNHYELALVCSAVREAALRGGKPDPALLAALADPEPLCRGAAAEVLAAAGDAHRPAVRKMLGDADPGVRLHAALGLARVKERAAVPVLIELLAELPEEQVLQVEEVLFRLAGETIPELPAPEAPNQRGKRREAWSSWWTKNGARVDLERLSGETVLGYTLAVTFHGSGVRVSEFGRDGKVLWAINGLDNAVDACMVGGNRVLIAEYGTARVTERTLDNKIVWEKKGIGNAILCQRLVNGHTFIVSSRGIVEVDRDGREVFTRAGGLRAAHKYRDGRIGMVTASGEYLRLDRTGKIEKQFPTGIQINNTLGGIDFLPDGGLLVGRPDRVVQLDAEGKEVWMVKVNRPYGPTRLANGNTLVACTASKEFLEFDRNGRTVRTLKVDGEPWVARQR